MLTVLLIHLSKLLVIIDLLPEQYTGAHLSNEILAKRDHVEFSSLLKLWIVYWEELNDMLIIDESRELGS
jgi:hypothetical protein